MRIFQFRNNRRNKKGSIKIEPLLIIILGVLGIMFFLSLIYFLAFNLTRQYLQLKETSTISGQPLRIQEMSSNLINTVLAKPIPVTGSVSKQTKQPDLTVRLKIPKINVNASVESVGIIANGEMGVPKGRNNVAWFNLGTYPGEIGSAVIDGHYGIWGNGQPAVFNDLTKLKVGDEILIEGNNGSTTVFVVREFRNLNDNEDATSIFTSSDGKAHLNLITCGGKWNKVLKSYPKRLIVFADKIF